MLTVIYRYIFTVSPIHSFPMYLCWFISTTSSIHIVHRHNNECSALKMTCHKCYEFTCKKRCSRVTTSTIWILLWKVHKFLKLRKLLKTSGFWRFCDVLRKFAAGDSLFDYMLRGHYWHHCQSLFQRARLTICGNLRLEIFRYHSQ